MREQPTWRIPAGVLGLFCALIVYGVAVARWLAPWFAGWPVLAQVPVYIVLGSVWLLPLRRFLIWMETGKWSA
jgi:hypothetical protein